MAEVKIKKAKIVDGLFLYVEYEAIDDNKNKKEKTEDSEIPIHEDLRAAFKRLDKHLALLCEEVVVKGKPSSIDDFDSESLYVKEVIKDEDVEGDEPRPRSSKYLAKSFSIGGKDENEGVTISGMKKLKTGKIVNLNTPFTKWSDEEYQFRSDLASDVQGCIYEVHEYLFKDKRAPEAQLSLAFPEDSEEGKYSEEGI